MTDQTQIYATTPWACVKDNHTGLVWEVKTPAGSTGIHDANNSYRWGGKTALLTESWGTVYIDWDTLVDGSNNNNLCGFNDWRVPAREALQSIVNLNSSNPAIDADYFPNTQSNGFWSSSPGAGGSNGAWLVNFDHGYGLINNRGVSDHVRLVRGGQ